MPPAFSSIALVVVSGCSFLSGSADRYANTIDVLIEQTRRWDRAIVAKHRDDIAANMSEDFRQIDRRGAVHDKDAFLDGILDPALEIDPYGVDDFSVRLYGDVALVSGRTRMTGRYEGKPFTSHYRFIDVYVRLGGSWKVVSVQITGVAG